MDIKHSLWSVDKPNECVYCWFISPGRGRRKIALLFAFSLSVLKRLYAATPFPVRFLKIFVHNAKTVIGNSTRTVPFVRSRLRMSENFIANTCFLRIHS